MEDKRKDGVEGEGSYSGSKDYNERTKKFVQSGKVDKAARDAEPKSEEEKHAMQKAERIGKERAKGEDPALKMLTLMKIPSRVSAIRSSRRPASPGRRLTLVMRINGIRFQL